MFASDVESVMASNGYEAEAKFCQLVRNWFNAEDEPAIPADLRCQYRLDIREWLLETYPFGVFPPATKYVRGVPIVSYEALVLHAERKIQLYAHVPGNSYNVRSTGSQEVKQFFSTFRDLDPTGKGTPKPDVIPQMMATVVVIDNFRLNPEKPFYIKTTRAEVYPNTTFMCTGSTTVEINTTDTNYEYICPKNHFFDLEQRGERRHRRKQGIITRPDDTAHGERGVRQYHARDDSKILAHRRFVLLELPD